MFYLRINRKVKKCSKKTQNNYCLIKNDLSALKSVVLNVFDNVIRLVSNKTQLILLT